MNMKDQPKTFVGAIESISKGYKRNKYEDQLKSLQQAADLYIKYRSGKLGEVTAPPKIERDSTPSPKRQDKMDKLIVDKYKKMISKNYKTLDFLTAQDVYDDLVESYPADRIHIAKAVEAEYGQRAFRAKYVPKMEGAGLRITRGELLNIVAKLKRVFGIDEGISVVGTPEEVPGYDPAMSVSARNSNDTLRPAGFYSNGNIWLINDNIQNEEEAITALIHETVGHKGFRNLFKNNKQFDRYLEYIYNNNKKGIAETAERLGLDLTNREDQLIAAEELMAQSAELYQQDLLMDNELIGMVDGFIARVKRFLIAMGFGKYMTFTNPDILALMAHSKKAINKGRDVRPVGLNKHHIRNRLRRDAGYFSRLSNFFTDEGAIKKQKKKLSLNTDDNGRLYFDGEQLKSFFEKAYNDGLFSKGEVEFMGLDSFVEKQLEKYDEIYLDEIQQFIDMNMFDLQDNIFDLGTTIDDYFEEARKEFKSVENRLLAVQRLMREGYEKIFDVVKDTVSPELQKFINESKVNHKEIARLEKEISQDGDKNGAKSAKIRRLRSDLIKGQEQYKLVKKEALNKLGLGGLDPKSYSTLAEIEAVLKKKFDQLRLDMQVAEETAGNDTGIFKRLPGADNHHILNINWRNAKEGHNLSESEERFTHSLQWMLDDIAVVDPAIDDNVINRVRFTIRPTSGSGNALHIEEIQNDWGLDRNDFEQGRTKEPVPGMPWMTNTAWIDLGLNRAIRYAVTHPDLNITHVTWSNGKEVHGLYKDTEKETGHFDRIYSKDIPKRMARLAKAYNGSLEDVAVETIGSRQGLRITNDVA